MGFTASEPTRPEAHGYAHTPTAASMHGQRTQHPCGGER